MTADLSEKKSIDLGDNNIYLFMEDFSRPTVKPVIEFILKKNLLAEDLKPTHLTLIICSPGGHLNSALALIDVMNGSSIPVRTVGIGQIASCGLLTFMSGAPGHRTITPNTSILSHQYSWSSYGKEHELIATVREFNLTTDRLMSLYKKCTKLDEETIKKWLLPPSDVWLDADQAVTYGLADKIKEL